MGSVILSMAELESDKGQFIALFNAIDKLSAFLVKDRAVEMKSFKIATAQFHRDINRFTKQRNVAQRKFKADQANLKMRLFPARVNYIKLIGRLQKQVKRLVKNLDRLRKDRLKEIAVYKQRSGDFVASISACKQAIPLLQPLMNGHSFAEVDADVFAQISGNLKQSLGKLEYGQLYTVFVDSMVTSLKMQNFVDQSSLQKVINQIKNLQERLEKGLVDLNNDEAVSKKNFQSAERVLLKAIKDTKDLIVLNQGRLTILNKKIVAVKKHMNQQIKVYKQKINSLILTNQQYKRRTQDHKRFIQEVDSEEATIAAAIRVLAKGGVTRNA